MRPPESDRPSYALCCALCGCPPLKQIDKPPRTLGELEDRLGR